MSPHSSVITLIFSILFVNISAAKNHLEQGDLLYAQRSNIENAHKALSLYELHLNSSPNDIEGLWRASMANYYIGHLVKKSKKRRTYFRNGIKLGEECKNASKSERVECLFWLATNTALLKKERGFLSLAFGISDIFELYEISLRLDPKYAQGGPNRMLALLYYKAPGFLGGDKAKAFRYILNSIKIAPKEPLNQYFYIKFLTDEDEEEKALKLANSFLKSLGATQPEYFESQNALRKIKIFVETKELP